MGGNADVVKLLLDKGADMGEPSTLTPTPYTLTSYVHLRPTSDRVHVAKSCPAPDTLHPTPYPQQPLILDPST